MQINPPRPTYFRSNRWKKLLFCLFLAGFAAPLYGEEFVSTHWGFSLTYPSTFKEAPRIGLSNAPLALSTPGRGFPTVNVLVQPGAYKWGPNEPGEEDRILESYRSVGILDPVIVSSKVLTINGARQFRVRVAYNYNNEKLHSLVGIISHVERHFILTCIDKAGDIEASMSVFTAILDSFKVTAPLADASQEELDGTGFNIFIIIGVVIFIVIVGVLSLQFLKRRKL